MSSDRMKILVSAYACDPSLGSEPGMGWNWIRHLAVHADLWVITEENRFASALRAGVDASETLKTHVHVIAIKRRRFGERIWSHLYYITYRQWQWEAYLTAVKYHEQVKFDVVHQLNMIGYREPGFLWKLPLPFVWGPIGGHSQMPLKYLPVLGVRGFLHYGIRNILNYLQMRTSARVRKAMTHAKVLIAATREDQNAIRSIHRRNALLMNEVGTEPTDALKRIRNRNPSTALNVSWCGRFIPLKALPLGLYALRRALVAGAKIRLHIAGDGQCRDKWRSLALKIGISEHCKWYGWTENERSKEIIASSDVLLFTSLQEGTSTVVLEAIQSAVPVICHDICGFGAVINDSCGIKIPISNPEQSIDGITGALFRLYHEPKLKESLSYGALSRAESLSWAIKAREVAELYKNAASLNMSPNAGS